MMIRHDWTTEEVSTLHQQPFMQLLYQAHTTHLKYFSALDMQISSILNIKTGACPEDCSYCSQSGRWNTGLKKEKMLATEQVLQQAVAAKARGAKRFCIAAAWRSPPEKKMPQIQQMIKGINALGLESCASLGKLDEKQAQALQTAGLKYYNHNIDTSPEYFINISRTRKFSERLKTLEYVRQTGMKVCCGGILSMGESVDDHINFLITLANLPDHPESVPINHLIKMPGTPLEHVDDLDSFDFIRVIALARIMMPKARIRLTAGRYKMNDELQALCFFSGANSIFLGEKLLTAKNPTVEADVQLLKRLGIKCSEQ